MVAQCCLRGSGLPVTDGVHCGPLLSKLRFGPVLNVFLFASDRGSAFSLADSRCRFSGEGEAVESGVIIIRSSRLTNRPTPKTLRLQIMTTANKISIARVLLVPFFVVQVLYYVNGSGEYHRLLAVLCFALAALTDGVDGYIARRYNQKSELGSVLDPLADKLLLVSAVIVLSMNNQPHLVQLPLWLAGTIIGRDVLLALGWFIIQHACGKVAVRPVLAGKIATVLQMICVLWALLKWSEFWLTPWAIAATFFTAVSGLVYVIDGVRQLSASPSSAAIPKQ